MIPIVYGCFLEGFFDPKFGSLHQKILKFFIRKVPKILPLSDLPNLFPSRSPQHPKAPSV
ncbi:MAG: hypothetical protein V7K90_22490 [Nostoc sp.]|uniref:hypothetical protein n=1 Tax=Nostoc sp. TaxID=1180 RepID=UPI002FF6F804